jgi:predicted amidophosphoribosyltransferase
MDYRCEYCGRDISANYRARLCDGCGDKTYRDFCDKLDALIASYTETQLNYLFHKKHFRELEFRMSDRLEYLRRMG